MTEEAKEMHSTRNWTIQPDGTVMLDPVVVVGGGHLEAYRNDPTRFPDGVVVKEPLPAKILDLFEERKARGEKLRIRVEMRYTTYGHLDLVLVHSKDDQKYPWRLLFEHPPVLDEDAGQS